MSKKFFVVAAVAVVAVLLGAFAAGCSSLPDNAAASVNGVIISKDAVTDRLRQIVGMSPGAISPDPSSQDYKDRLRDITSQLVAEEIERQEAAKRNVSVSDDEVNKALNQVVEDRFYGDASQLQDFLSKRNVTLDDLKAQLKRQILHQKMMDSVKAEVKVNDSDVQAAYQEGISNYVHPERRQVRQIVTADQASAMQAANRIASGEEFATVAKQVSIDAKTKNNGGFVGIVTKGELPPAVGDAAFSLQLNQISTPVKSDQGWYIVRVELIQPAMNQSFDSVKQQLTEYVTNQKYSQRWADFQKQIQDSYDVQFADDYSPRTVDTTGTGTTPGGAAASDQTPTVPPQP